MSTFFDESSGGSRRSACCRAQSEIPMTTPLVPGVCPCGRPGGEDGFCAEHAGAVAFKVPVDADGDILPAVWWHWPHPDPCPDGEAWMITPPSAGTREALWACTHRTHEIAEGELSDERDLSEEAAG